MLQPQFHFAQMVDTPRSPILSADLHMCCPVGPMRNPEGRDSLNDLE
jgi:hypothetical protein